MKKAVGCAALSCALGLAHAKALKWSEDGPRWSPAQETPVGVMLALAMDPPMPTPAPPSSKVKAVLKARGSTDNTCGYVSGIPSKPIPGVEVYALGLTRHSIVPLVRRDRQLCLQLAEHAHRLLRRHVDQLPDLDSVLRLDGA